MTDQTPIGRFRGIWQPALALACLLVVTGVIVACSSGGGVTSASSAVVNVRLSDPATCEAPNGPFSNVWVTITDVQVNTNASAGPNDSSWVDLTPNLASAPKQVDLLSQANNQCFLASLGDNLQLQAGSYQQIRVILADNSAASMASSNPCSTAGSANCVVTSNGTFPLLLSSEDKTGIKIPSGQLAGGAFTIAAGQTKDLDIDFNTCASIVQEGNGGYRLKPVLHAGEVSLQSNTLNGTVLDAATGQPVAGNVFVSLEQPVTVNNVTVDRVVMQTQAAVDGTFVFCPLPTGTYDVVVVGMRSADGTLYQPSIVTAVATGATTGNINLYAPAASSPNAGANSVANLQGVLTTTTAAASVPLSVLETVGTTTYTIPQQPPSNAVAPYLPYYQSTLLVTTSATATPACPTGTDCFNYSLPVSSGGPYIGAWAAGGASLQPASATTALGIYSVDGTATTCTPSPTEANSGAAIQLVTPPFTTVPMTQNIAFTGCQ